MRLGVVGLIADDGGQILFHRLQGLPVRELIQGGRRSGSLQISMPGRLGPQGHHPILGQHQADAQQE